MINLLWEDPTTWAAHGTSCEHMMGSDTSGGLIPRLFAHPEEVPGWFKTITFKLYVGISGDVSCQYGRGCQARHIFASELKKVLNINPKINFDNMQYKFTMSRLNSLQELAECPGQSVALATVIIQVKESYQTIHHEPENEIKWAARRRLDKLIGQEIPWMMRTLPDKEGILLASLFGLYHPENVFTRSWQALRLALDTQRPEGEGWDKHSQRLSAAYQELAKEWLDSIKESQK